MLADAATDGKTPIATSPVAVIAAAIILRMFMTFLRAGRAGAGYVGFVRDTMVTGHRVICLDIYPVASCLLSVAYCAAPRGKVPMLREALSSSFRPESSGPGLPGPWPRLRSTRGHLASPGPHPHRPAPLPPAAAAARALIAASGPSQAAGRLSMESCFCRMKE